MGSARGFHPQGGMHSAGCPSADSPHPRPAPLTELHQRRVGRRSTPGSRRGTRSSASASWPRRRRRRRAGGVRRVSSRPRPPASLQAPPPAPAPCPALLTLGSDQLPGAALAAPVWAHFRSVCTPPSLCNFRSHCLVLGTTEVGTPYPGVSSVLGRWSGAK